VREGAALATLGVLLTALVAGAFAHLIFGLPFPVGILLGAIVSSTDAAAVFAVLRSRSVGLKGRLQPLLELESGSNDPMAVFLTVGLTAMILEPSPTWWDLLWLFVRQMTLGAGLGVGAGLALAWLLNRVRLEYDGLYPVLTLASVPFTYGVTAYLGGNGFLAVYVAGIVLGNRRFIHKRSLLRYHDGLAWLMQIAMFVILGLLVFPSRLVPVAGSAILMSAALVMVARPIGVSLSLLAFRTPLREIGLVSWVGLRGAVPIVLATFPLVAGVPQAETIFNAVFFVVLTSVLVQGPTIPLVARWLRVDAPLDRKRAQPLDFDPAGTMRSDLVEIEIPPGSPVAGKQLVGIGLPADALVVLIGRSDEYFVPRGASVVLAGDRLLTLADPEAVQAIERLVDKRNEPAPGS
jgi:potassium/hydrogen antiporter